MDTHKPLTGGSSVSKFEREFARYVGVKHAVAVTSGTAALHLACMQIIGTIHKKRVDVPVMTYVATANAPMLCGMEVSLYDNMSEDAPGYKDIIVHYGGEAYGKKAMIEDASHALGALYADGKVVGSCPESLMTCFSFHPTKHITCGQGGMITTNDDNIARDLRRMRGNGIERGYSEEPWRYQWVSHGLNYEMSEVNAALGFSQLMRINTNISQRKYLAGVYYDNLPKQIVNYLARGTQPRFNYDCSYHLFPVLIDFKKIGQSRQQIMAKLLAKGIETQVHYTPLHLQPMLSDQYAPGDFPAAMKFYEQELSLPMHHDMTDGDVIRVCNALKEIL
jgi:dTDP-4-amino-4,6-dideoxygalactose transaminase